MRTIQKTPPRRRLRPPQRMTPSRSVLLLELDERHAGALRFQTSEERAELDTGVVLEQARLRHPVVVVHRYSMPPRPLLHDVTHELSEAIEYSDARPRDRSIAALTERAED